MVMTNGSAVASMTILTDTIRNVLKPGMAKDGFTATTLTLGTTAGTVVIKIATVSCWVSH
jgi:hypothetical protein